MAFRWNPFTGTLDYYQTQSGSGGIPGTGFVDQAKWLVIEKLASEDISALRMVRFVDADSVGYARPNTNYNDAKAVGIALNAAITGANVKVLILGVLEDAFFTYPPNTVLFLDVDGQLTSTPPTTGYSVIIGESPATGVLSLGIREPTIL